LIFENGFLGIELSPEYRTGDKDPALFFYKPCILNSIEYKRAVGYFRSSIFQLVGIEIIEFAKNGGKIKLVCSPSLAEEDIESIKSGYKDKAEIISQCLVDEIEQLIKSESTSDHTKILATLISVGILDIKIAIRPESYGQYHEKIGIFKDKNENMISFIGSANETWSGWHFQGNHEAIEVFRSWHDNSDFERVARHNLYFDRLWANDIPGLETLDFPIAAKNKLLDISENDLDKALEILTNKNSNIKAIRKPFKHQIDALDAWKLNNKRGILEHATGSGKTFTAIIAIKEHIDNGYPVLILVPSKLLLDQWDFEIKNEIADATILLAGAGNNKWRNDRRLRSMTSGCIPGEKRITISTMQTAATSEFINQIPKTNNLLLVADEVHQTGSSFISNLYEINANARLGLSATPKRYGDSFGTDKMILYFGGIISPPFTLENAISTGRLVRYEYYPHEVHLTKEESEEWSAITKRIIREISQCKDSSGNITLSDRAKLLLIQRSRISKKAVNKAKLSGEVIRSNYHEGHRWLVYCEDIDHLNIVREEIRKIGLNSVEYHSQMHGDKETTLKWFSEFGGILVSIKCLDEGVDIPSIDHALILSSSQNPRQFIQRRGRVLRIYPGKHKAVIHDALVVPICVDDEPDQISLLKSELARAIQFADSAINKSAASKLRIIAAAMNIDLESTSDNGIEEDFNNERE